MKLGVMGGGINGFMTTWKLVRRGRPIELFEQGRLMSAGGTASTNELTKTPHGGLRYLKRGYFGLVRDALYERCWWISQAPELTKSPEIGPPINLWRRHPRCPVAGGILPYYSRAAVTDFQNGCGHSCDEVKTRLPALESCGLRGASSCWDGQIDGYCFVLGAAEQAAKEGQRIEPESNSSALNSQCKVFDHVINVTTRWERGLSISAASSFYRIDFVCRSSPVLVAARTDSCALQVVGRAPHSLGAALPRQFLVGANEFASRVPMISSRKLRN